MSPSTSFLTPQIMNIVGLIKCWNQESFLLLEFSLRIERLLPNLNNQCLRIKVGLIIMSGCKFPFNAIKLLKIEVDLE
jgi:hypothetical protein